MKKLVLPCKALKASESKLDHRALGSGIKVRFGFFNDQGGDVAHRVVMRDTFLENQSQWEAFLLPR